MATGDLNRVDPGGGGLPTAQWERVREARAHDFRIDDFIEATASGLTRVLQRRDRLVVSELPRLGRSLGQIARARSSGRKLGRPGPGVARRHALQLRAGERGVGDAAAGLHEKGGKRHDVPAHHWAAVAVATATSRWPGSRSRSRALFQSVTASSPNAAPWEDRTPVARPRQAAAHRHPAAG